MVFALIVSKTDENTEKPFKTLLYIETTLVSKNPLIVSS